MLKNRKIGVGLVGCGQISKKHIEALKQINEIELVAVCDVKKDLADKFSHDFGIKAYYDYEEMLKDNKIELIDICTPSGLHAPLAIKAAKAKKHIVCEKPMALKLKDAGEMINVCHENKVRLFVIKQNRLNPLIMKLRDSLENERFGKIFLLNVTVRWQRPQKYYDEAKWRGTVAMDGGVLMNQASHHVDLIQWMGGPVKSVFAKKKTMCHRIETEDTAVVVLEFESGAVGVIEATTCAYPENIEGSITVMGENGTVKIGGPSLNKVEIWRFKDKTPEDESMQNYFLKPEELKISGHLQYFKNVVDVLKRNEKAFTDGKAGIKSLEIIEAIYKSVEEKREVQLPLK